MRDRSGYGWLQLLTGIVLVLFGIITYVRPGNTMAWLVVIYGLIAIVTGICDIILYVKTTRFTGFGPMMSLVTGIFSIMAGAMLLVYPGTGIAVMVVLLPIWFIAHCISRLCQLSFIREESGPFHYWFTLVVNIGGLVLGFLMIIRPYISFLAVGMLIGTYLLLTGVDMIITAVGRLGRY